MKNYIPKVSIAVLLLLVLSNYVQAQTMYTGKITDSTNEPLIGVSVHLKDTYIGIITDIDGKFRLAVPVEHANSKLIFSMVGYVTQEVSLGGNTVFNIVLIEDQKLLNEVVVTGYVTEQREKVTGAISTVSSKNLVKLAVPSLDQAIQGRVAGVVVTQNTGAPGEGVGIRIRGFGSINSGNYPLYIVDGIPTLDINAISLQDIESLSILKDASAAALYGARAANGVVIITTKTGKGSEPQIQISSQIGVQSASRLIDMANAQEYVNIYNESANNDNIGKTGIFLRPLITEDMASTFDNVNYVEEIMQDALLQTHSVSISGSEGKTNYLVSGSYFGQEGILKSSDFDRVTGRVNVETEIKKWLSIGVNLNVAKSTTNIVGSSGDGAGGNGGSVVRYAFFRTPPISIYDGSGEFTDKPDLFRFLGDGFNPVGMLEYNENEKISDRLFGKFFFKITPMTGMTFVSNIGIDIKSENQRRFDRNWGTANRVNNPNRLSVTDTRFQGLTFSNFLTYDKSFGVHNFSFLVGTEAIQNENYGINASDNSFPDQKQSLIYLGNGQGTKTINEFQTGNTLLSFFGKTSYDYDEKYLASVTLRRDGSSRFGSDTRWGTFYAGSVGWRLDREDFLSNATWLDALMVRAGYGSIGNQEISDYPSIAKVGTNFYYPYGNTSSVGYAIDQLGNSKVKWETSQQVNVGIDMEVWSGKLFFAMDYFHKTTSDLLVNQPIASSAGSASPSIINNGKVLNKGLEITLTHANSFGDLGYSITGNMATLQNEVLEVDPVIQGGAIGSDNITLVEKGYPISSFYIYEMEGIFQNAADIFTHASQGQDIEPGDIKFKDQNNDGVINAEDRTHAGSPIPDFTAAINLSLNFKNWDLSLFFQGAFGQEIYSVLNRDIEGFYRPFNVTQRYYDNHWTGEGSSNKFPRASWDASGNNTKFSTRFMEDGSYVRLKNLQIGYSFPPPVLDRMGFSSLRIYVSGINLLTFTNYEGLDPEMTVSDNALNQGDRANGMDWGTYPSSKSYNVGINLIF